MLSAFILLSSSLLPCRYTVRDVAFVDLGDPPYRLVTYLTEEDGAVLHEDLYRLTTAVLADSNVEGCFLDPDGVLNEEDALRLSTNLVREFPFTALVSPTGEELVLPWQFVGDDANESADRLFYSVLRSPARDSISDALIESYCVVVLVEGYNATENEAAHAVVEGALEELAAIFDEMPKDVGKSPRCVAVTAGDYAREEVLLWSLGLEDPGRQGPAVAVLFGRGRRVGPLLLGDALDVDGLFKILATVGLDCECGLDRSWMRGMRIPLRWDESMRQHSANLLGFDPDNPLVRYEVSSLIARHPTGTGSSPALSPTLTELILDYREEAVETDSLAPPPPEGTLVTTGAADPAPVERSDTALKSLLIAFSAIAGLSVICSVAVLLKTRPQ